MGRRRDHREGRGRLSAIDMLPEEAEEDIAWALEQLRTRKLPQTALLEEFNLRLADKGLAPVSKSSWNRYSVRKAIMFRKLDEMQRMSGELMASLGTEGPDQVTVAVAEMLKLAAFQALEDDNMTTKGIMELSRALQSAVGAQKTSAEYRQRLEAELQGKLAKAADAVNAIGAKSGISKEALDEINRRLLGGA